MLKPYSISSGFPFKYAKQVWIGPDTQKGHTFVAIRRGSTVAVGGIYSLLILAFEGAFFTIPNHSRQTALTHLEQEAFCKDQLCVNLHFRVIVIVLKKSG